MRRIIASIAFALAMFALPACERTSPPPPVEAREIYKCTMDEGTRTTPGPCPVCGMTLDESHRVKP